MGIVMRAQDAEEADEYIGGDVEHIVPSAQVRVTPSAHARVTEAEQRSDRAQDPCALRVAACARAIWLDGWPTSTMYSTSPAVGRLAAGPAALATRPLVVYQRAARRFLRLHCDACA